MFPEAAGEPAEETTLAALSAKDRILLLTGIASPARIREKLRQYAPGIAEMTFGDHHDFSASDLREIERRFDQLTGERKLIVTTEKDAVRLTGRELTERVKRALYQLPVEVKIIHEQHLNFNKSILSYVDENKRDSGVPEK